MTTLNPGAFTTVFDDNFRTDTSINQSLWTNIWGYPGQISLSGGMLTLTSFANQYWASTALMQRATGPSAGEGYGLYQVTAYTNPGQGIGVNLLLWRADNVWLDPKTPGKATEMDLIETYESPSQALSTIHYYDPGSQNDNGSAYHTFPNVNPTQVHTYSLDWERGSLTYYIDGVEMYKDTTHAPLDYADGGTNEVMGLQVSGSAALATSSSVAVHILEASYSAPAGTPVPTPTPTPTPPSGPVTLGGGAQNYAAAAGTVVLAGPGNDTISASAGLVTVTGSSGTLDFFGGSGASSVTGGSGSATLYGGSGGGLFVGGTAGNNVLISQGASGKNTTLTGAGAGDRIFGSASGTDVLNAGPGGDTVVGGGGPETIFGGGTAAAAIFTGTSKTVIDGGAKGGDQIITGKGATTVQAQNGDAIFGNIGTLNVTGSSAGADSIAGGAGALVVSGRGGNMLVVAGTSTSNINVGSGASLIYAGSGSSTVAGGAGSLQLVVGSGKSSITEGAGSAVYDISSGAAGGTVTINNYKAASDKIDLYGYNAGAMTTTVSGGSTLLSLSDGTKIELVGVTNVGSSIVG